MRNPLDIDQSRAAMSSPSPGNSTGVRRSSAISRAASRTAVTSASCALIAGASAGDARCDDASRAQESDAFDDELGLVGRAAVGEPESGIGRQPVRSGLLARPAICSGAGRPDAASVNACLAMR